MTSADQLLAEGRTDDARALFAARFESAESDDERYLAAMGVAVCQARKGLWTEAITDLAQIIERYPGSGAARAYYGACLFESGQIQPGLNEVDVAIELAPDEAIPWIKRAELRGRMGMLREALADFQQAALVPTLDDSTREFVRGRIVQMRRELSVSVERVLPVPGQLLKRIRQRNAAGKAESTTPIIPVGLSWRDR